VSSQQISRREQTVLKQVITLHYRTCEPVASTLVYKTRALPYSPATIRYIMGALEQQGLLIQPHKSSGRLPTDRGYRSYVNDISLNFEPLGPLDQRTLDSIIESSDSRIGILAKLAHHLNRKTGLISFHVPYKLTGIRVKSLHFQRLDSKHVLAVPITRTGQTFHHILNEPDSGLSDTLLEKAHTLIDREFSGYSLMEIRRRLNALLQRRSSHMDLLLSALSRLLEEVEAQWKQLDDIEFTGFSNLFEVPEFQELSRLKTVYRLLEDHQRFDHLLRRAHAEGESKVVVFIGAETEWEEIEFLTIYLTQIINQRDLLGYVGLLGPKRMPYLTALQLLSYAKHRIANHAYD